MHEVWTTSLLPFHPNTMLAVCWSASQSRLQASCLIFLISAHQFTASVGDISICPSLLVCETYCCRVATNDSAVHVGCRSGDGVDGHSLCASVGRWNACAADQNDAQTAHFNHVLVM